MEKAEYSIRTHSNDCYRQDSQMNDKINEWSFKEKQDICMTSEYFLLRNLIISVLVLMNIHKLCDALPSRKWR